MQKPHPRVRLFAFAGMDRALNSDSYDFREVAMRPPIHIRRAMPGDRSAVTQLFRKSYPQLLPDDYSAPTLRAVLPHITTAQPGLLACGTYYLAQEIRALSSGQEGGPTLALRAV